MRYHSRKREGALWSGAGDLIMATLIAEDPLCAKFAEGILDEKPELIVETRAALLESLGKSDFAAFVRGVSRNKAMARGFLETAKRRESEGEDGDDDDDL